VTCAGRYFLNVLALASLLVCLATAALWVRSHGRRDALSRANGTEIVISSHGGRLALTVTKFEGWHDAPPCYGWRHDEPASLRWAFAQPVSGEDRRIDRFGFLWAVRTPTYSTEFVRQETKWNRANPVLTLVWSLDIPGARPTNPEWFPVSMSYVAAAPGYRLAFPHWSIVMATSLLPAARLRSMLRAFRRRQRLPGLCPTCGYDLRATPDRCPECGTAADAPPHTVRR
jgi:hypothetical protein